jgi:hypothetical protein
MKSKMHRRNFLAGIGAAGLSGCKLEDVLTEYAIENLDWPDTDDEVDRLLTEKRKRPHPHGEPEPTIVRPRVGWVPGDPYRPAPNEAVVVFEDIGHYDALPRFKRTIIIVEADGLFPLVAGALEWSFRGSIWTCEYSLGCPGNLVNPITHLHVLISDRGYGTLKTISAEFEACDPSIEIRPTWFEPFGVVVIAAERQ